MPALQDGPASPLFRPLPFEGNVDLPSLAGDTQRTMAFGMTAEMATALPMATSGSSTAWGIPFEIGRVALLAGEPVTVEVAPTTARWLVFMHTSDIRPLSPGRGGIIAASRGAGQLAERAAAYVMCYTDGTEARASIRRRYELGAFQRGWGENCFASVAEHKPYPLPAHHEQPLGFPNPWGERAYRAGFFDRAPWVNWLWAWENPLPEKTICGIRFEPASGVVLVSAVSAGNVDSSPLRWQTRRKARLILPPEHSFPPELDREGLLEQVRIDLGQVISARPRLIT